MDGKPADPASSNEPRSVHHAKTLPSVRTRLTLTILACVLPSLVGLGLLVVKTYERERAQMEEDQLQMVRAMTATLDRELSIGKRIASVLATSPYLADGDLAAFHAEAQGLVTADFPGFNFVLFDEQGQQLLNTLRPFGMPLPTQPELRPLLHTVFGEHRPVISDLFTGGVLHRPVISINVPVTVNGVVKYDLAVGVLPETLARVLAEQRLPKERIAAIVDSKGTIVARTRLPERYVGKPATPELVAHMQREPEAIVDTETVEGVRAIIAYSRSQATGWLVAIAIPKEAALIELLRAISPLAIMVAVLLSVGLVAIWILGGKISRSLVGLTEPILALGHGTVVPIRRSSFREMAEVTEAALAVERELTMYRQGLAALVDERTASLRLAESALKVSEKRLRLFAELAPGAVAMFDLDMRYLVATQRWYDDYGLTGRDVVGMSHYEVFPEMPEHWKLIHRNCLAGAIEQRDEDAFVHEDGTTQWLKWEVRPWRDADDRIGGIFIWTEDITAWKQAREALRESEERFRGAFATAPHGMALVSLEGRWLKVNHAMCDLVGYTEAELLATNFQTITHPDDLSVDLGHVQDLLAGKVNTYQMEKRYFHRRGAIVWVLLSVSLVRDESGVPQYFVSQIQNIGQRKEAEAKLRLVLDSVTNGILVTDRTGHIVMASSPAERMFGYAPSALIGAHIATLVTHQSGTTDPTPAAHSQSAFLPQIEGVYRVVGTRRDGDTFPIELDLRPVDTPDGPQCVLSLSDVSVRIQTDNALRRAKEYAERASVAKSEFLANMSHEIRTPLNAIIGFSKLLEDMPLPERERDYVEKVGSASQALMAIINDILDFSKIEAGRLELEYAPITLDVLLRGVAVITSTTADEKGLETVFRMAPEVPIGVIGDQLRLQQILLNLMGNAVKFTHEGEVVLSVDRVAESADEITLAFSVRDTGIGISPEQQQSLFAAFSQADTSTSRRYGGTGLGLAISHRLATLMGAELTVSSEPGKGSEFRFAVPFRKAADVGDVSAQVDGDLCVSVLIVDDNESARTALAEMCRSFKWTATTAGSAEEGLAQLRQPRPAGGGFDIMIVDARMPGTNGIDMVRAARADRAISLPPIILAVTSRDAADLMRDADALNVQGVLTKPITASSLHDVIAQVWRGVPVQTLSVSAPLMTGQLIGLHLLLVEDNPVNQLVAKSILEKAGASLEVASDGLAAIALLRDHPERFHAVLMDIQMPGMDGYEATQAIRQQLGLVELPVIAMTANAMDEDRRRSKEAGLNAHVAKPINVRELFETLHRHARPAGGATAVVPELQRQALDLPDTLPGIDLENVLLRLSGDAALWANLLHLFVEAVPSQIEEMQQLQAAGKWDRIGLIMHTIRGSAGNVGAADVAQLAKDAELPLKQGQAVDLADWQTRFEIAMAAVRTADEQVAHLRMPGIRPPAHEGPSLDEVSQILALVHQHNLKAVDLFRSLSGRIAFAYGEDQATRIAQAFDALDYAAAANQLNALLQTLGDPA